MFTGNNLSISGGTFINVNQDSDAAFNQLRDAVAHGALHDSGQRHSPPKCHENTRLSVLEKIKDWVGGNPIKPVMWMFASAGVGKSAIAQTLAEQLAAEKRLLASFFFARFDLSRNNGDHLVATIAYQAALNIPEIRGEIADAVARDPLIFKRSLVAQFRLLIIPPLTGLMKSGYFDNPLSPRLIILDGLDECKDIDIQDDILRSISDSFHSLPFKILIASRPEQHLSIGFESSFTPALVRLNLNDWLSSDDIRLFLQDEFNKIKRTHPLRAHIPSDWPDECIVNKLVNRAGGQFIYASTIIKYVAQIRYRPPNRLEKILGNNPEPFSTIDQLYRDIFSSVEDVQRVLDILCVALLCAPSGTNTQLKVREVEAFFSLEPGDPELILGELASVLTLIREEDIWMMWITWVRITHASLDDFLRNASRSKELYIDSPERHARLARRCIEILRESDHSLKGRSHQRLLVHLSYVTREDLRSLIIDLPLASLYQDSKLVIEVIEFIVKCFELVEEDIELHRALWQVFYVNVIGLVEVYYSDPVLTLLMAVMGMPEARCSYHLCSAISALVFANHNSRSIDRRTLRIAIPLTTGGMQGKCRDHKYVELLSAVLDDKRTDSKYSINGQKYACTTQAHCDFPEGPGSSGDKSVVRDQLLPLFLERAEPAKELDSFITQNFNAKTILQEVIREAKLGGSVIAEYLNR